MSAKPEKGPSEAQRRKNGAFVGNESLPSMRARLPLALEEVYNPREFITLAKTAPPAIARHCFRFRGGLRLVVNRMSWGGPVSIQVMADLPDPRLVSRALEALGMILDVGEPQVRDAKWSTWFWDEQTQKPRRGPA